MYGFTKAVQLKFAVVSEIFDTGKRKKLNRIISGSPDIFAEMAVTAVRRKGDEYE
jgi:hypothetical protein